MAHRTSSGHEILQRGPATVESSASAEPDGVLESLDAFWDWWAQRRAAGRFSVTRIPFSDLEKWNFEPTTGNLVHETGRFFTIEGVRVEQRGKAIGARPIINQPEIGMLGILVREFNGVPHCLMQAKMEPGNINQLQLSPTVQATRSNYTKAHRGSGTRFLEFFAGHDRGDVLVDVLQSEQGSWFWRKRNRNIVVRVTEDVGFDENFRWLPISLIRELMKVDNLVNMDARTVLSCLSFARSEPVSRQGSFTDALERSYRVDRESDSRHSFREIQSWFIGVKTQCDWNARLVPLTEVPDWSCTADQIIDDPHRRFRIVGVHVAAGNREVTRWTQPLLEPHGRSLALFVTRRISGVLHVLVQARAEWGLLDLVEMAPTVHALPGEDGVETGNSSLDEVLAGTRGEVRFDATLSEEGGRFQHALTRYLIVEVNDEFPTDMPERFCWMTLRQLMDLLRHGHYLNIEARTLLACLHSLC